MTINIDPSVEAGVITVVLDPRIAYVGFGPDDGELAQTVRRHGVDEALEDLADAAEQLDFAYKRAWANAAERVAPDLAWGVSAPYHQPVDDFPLLDSIAKTGRGVGVRDGLLGEITGAITVEVETLSVGATRWSVIDGGRMVGSATVPHTVRSVQDRHINDTATRIRENDELLRSVDYDGLRLDLFEPSGGLGAGPEALGYVLNDRGTAVFAGTDFRSSPLHAIDSDRTVEALAEFLALTPGGTDEEYFANYTERQTFWTAGDGPSRLYELITELPGDTEYRSQMEADAGLRAEQRGEIRAWHVRPLERTDLPDADLLADGAGNARAQYPAYVSAWLADTGRDIDIDDDQFPALSAQPSTDAIHNGRPVVSVVRGQHTLDWAVEHVNYWQTDSYVTTGLIPTDTVLNIPATGAATMAIRNASATAHAGARVDAHNRSHVTALADSQVHIHPGACVDRQPGSFVALAPESRMPQQGGAFRDMPVQRRPLGR